MSELSPGTTATLSTTASDLTARNGQSCTVVRTITERDATHDDEALPMVVVRFDDGTECEVWPDELRA